jgi:hypothetical protein
MSLAGDDPEPAIVVPGCTSPHFVRSVMMNGWSGQAQRIIQLTVASSFTPEVIAAGLPRVVVSWAARSCYYV